MLDPFVRTSNFLKYLNIHYIIHWGLILRRLQSPAFALIIFKKVMDMVGAVLIYLFYQYVLP